MQSIEAVFENGVFRPLQAVELPEHCRVLITPHAIAQTDGAGAAPAIEDQLAALGAAVPDDEWRKLPTDLTSRLDDFLYGASH